MMINREMIEDIYELSPLQQGLLFHYLSAPNAGMYTIQLHGILHGTLDMSAFNRAWQAVVERHTILRTGFFWEELDKPLQIVYRQATLPIEVTDWQHLSEPEQEQALQTYLQKDRYQNYQLTSPPVMRLAVFCSAPDKYYFVWNFHHLILDGWCLGMVLEEVFAFYHAFQADQPLSLPESPPYGEYIAWLQAQDLFQAEMFWRKKLAGFSVATALGIDHPPKKSGDLADTHQEKLIRLSPPFSKTLETVARQNRFTLNTLMQGAWALLLQHYSQTDDLVFGITVSGRPTDLPGVEKMVGLFINTLPLRVSIPPNTTLIAWLQDLQTQQANLREYEYTPLVKIQKWSEVPQGDPLFDSLFVFENYPGSNASPEEIDPTTDHPPLDLEIFPTNERTNYPLTLVVAPSQGGIYLKLIYDTTRFDELTADRVLNHLQQLLQQIATTPHQKIHTLSPLLEVEKTKLLVTWNNTQTNYPTHKIMPTLFEEQASQHPDRVALIFNDERMTYGELNEKANQVAHYLHQAGIGPEKTVGLCVERSLEMVIGLLAILKAGGVYIPLNPLLSAQQLTFILNNTKTSFILSQTSLLPKLPLTSQTVICLDSDRAKFAATKKENLGIPILPKNLAYIMYTSGTTGKPKGVQISHQALVNFLYSMTHSPGLTAADTLLAVTTFSFDIAGLELYLPLLNGGKIVLASREATTDGQALLNLLNEHKITILQATPATWQMLIMLDWPGNKQLKMLCGGEGLPLNLAQNLVNRGKTLWNMYGPTETTIWSSTYQVSPNSIQNNQDKGFMPIGQPIANTQLYVLDQLYNPVAIGIPGELYIGGDGLARGYFNQPGLTAEKFIPNPFAQDSTIDSQKSGQENQEISLTPAGSRLYKTGDLVRYQTDGTLAFLGRRDHQVKVRGYRIELGGIEAVLGQAPGIQNQIVLVREDTPGKKELVAYFTAKEGHTPTVGLLRDFLQEQLPPYMIPTAFVNLDTFPLSRNNKIDRKALPVPDDSARQSSEVFEAPRTPTEETLAEVWGKVLGIEKVSIHDNFFELGGDSIIAIQVVAKASQAKIQLTPKNLFDHSTIAKLAANVTGKSTQTTPRVTAVTTLKLNLSPESRDQLQAKYDSVADIYPLSPTQEGMLFHSLYAQKGGEYVQHQILTLKGTLKPTLFKQAWTQTISQEPVLRTIFVWEDVETPVQVVLKGSPLAWEDLNWVSLSPTEQELALNTLIETDQRSGFILSQPPLIRFKLIQVAPDTYHFIFSHHHILIDGWSLSLIISTAFETYYAMCEGDIIKPMVARPYKDYIIWLQNQDMNQSKLFWQTYLKDFITPTQFPFKSTNHLADQTGDYQTIRTNLTINQTTDLQNFARQHKITPNTIVQAAWAILLSRYSNQNEVVYGSVVSGRSANIPDIENIIGLFINTLPIRAQFKPDTNLIPWLQDFQINQVELRQYEYTPLVDIQTWSDVPAGLPLFESLIAFENFPIDHDKLIKPGQLMIEEIPNVVRTGYPLGMTAVLGETLILDLYYDSTQFKPKIITGLGNHLKSLLSNITNPAVKTLFDLKLLNQAEETQILRDWNQTKAPYPDKTSVHHLFEAQVQNRPNDLAVIYQDQTLTYQALNQRANQLAHYLKSQGIGPEVVVGLCVERSLDLIIGMMGILKTGGAYVPLDPAYPPDRLAFMMADAEIALLLTQAAVAKSLAPQTTPTLSLDGDWSKIATYPTRNLNVTMSPANLAYILYTSGSTGKPKGVQIPHRGLCNVAQAQQTVFQLPPQTRGLQLASLSFDACVFEILMVLPSGGTICLAPREKLLPGPALVDSLKTLRVNIITITPSALMSLPPEDLPDLQIINVAGEACPPELIDRWANQCRFFNLYGPTEDTIWATFTRCYPGQTLVSIGKPIINNQVYLLDQYLHPVPIGVPGEIYLGGVGVARGYQNRPGLTAQTFIPHPFSRKQGRRLYKTGDLARYLADGQLEFVGRVDHQVKIRGFRIETGEIEAVLNNHPDVQACVVTTNQNKTKDNRLIAYFTSLSAKPPNLSDLRTFLSLTLPDYMIPAVFVELDEFPLTPNGKLDLKSLPNPDHHRLGGDAPLISPRDETEQTLVNIWEDLLNTTPIGINNNFFEVGGHSILAVRLMTQIQKQFKQELPLSIILQEGTIEKLASHLRNETDFSQYSPLVPLALNGSKKPFFCIHPGNGDVLGYIELSQKLQPDYPFYGIQDVMRFNKNLPSQKLEEMAAFYITKIQEFQARGPYHLGGWSFGGQVAFEMAQQLQATGEQVGLLAILDTSSPDVAASMANVDEKVLLAIITRELIGEGEKTVTEYVNIFAGLSPEEQIKYAFNLAKAADPDDPDFDLNQFKQKLNVFKNRTEALKNYQPQVYTGHITLFRAIDHVYLADKALYNTLAESSLDPTFGWSKFSTEPVEVHFVPGYHETLVHQPYVDILARQLKTCLAKYDI